VFLPLQTSNPGRKPLKEQRKVIVFSSPFELNLSGNSTYCEPPGYREVWQRWRLSGACSRDPGNLQTGRPRLLGSWGDGIPQWHRSNTSYGSTKNEKRKKLKYTSLTTFSECWKDQEVKSMELQELCKG
jgi:hypothetical protein